MSGPVTYVENLIYVHTLNISKERGTYEHTYIHIYIYVIGEIYVFIQHIHLDRCIFSGKAILKGLKRKLWIQLMRLFIIASYKELGR